MNREDSDVLSGLDEEPDPPDIPATPSTADVRGLRSAIDAFAEATGMLPYEDDISNPTRGLTYHGEDDNRSRQPGWPRGMSYPEWLEWTDKRPDLKWDPAARARRKARWHAERNAAERVRIDNNPASTRQYQEDAYALDRLADEWIANPHT